MKAVKHQILVEFGTEPKLIITNTLLTAGIDTPGNGQTIIVKSQDETARAKIDSLTVLQGVLALIISQWKQATHTHQKLVVGLMTTQLRFVKQRVRLYYKTRGLIVQEDSETI